MARNPTSNVPKIIIVLSMEKAKTEMSLCAAERPTCCVPRGRWLRGGWLGSVRAKKTGRERSWGGLVSSRAEGKVCELTPDSRVNFTKVTLES